MSFENFAKDDPSQIVLGLFNGTLQAVYLFSQISPSEFDAHFTSSRKANRKDVLAGAATMVKWFEENGLEIVAHVAPNNTPLRAFLEEAGLRPKKVLHFDTASDTVSATSQLWLEYRSGQVNPNRALGQEANLNRHVGNNGEL